MRHLKIGFPLLGILLGAIGLTACADESPWGTSSNEKGSISITLSTDSGIKTAKPVFRSEDDENAEDPNNLGTYCSLPSPDDFKIKLEKVSTGEVSTWSSLTAFKEHIANNSFETGTYTLTAYYGEKGKQDFESPYFEGSSTFNVLSDQDNEVNLTAELKNSLVKINYTEGFKNYMKDYHTNIRTEGLSDPITYGTLEARPVFIEPNNANLTLYFTTSVTGMTSSLSLGDFAPMAKTLHNITFDIKESTSFGDATLDILFDETLEDENISIDLTKELLTTPAPTIACEGFENGQTLDMLDADANTGAIRMIANTSDKIASAIMTIESANYVPSWGAEIDLCKATPEQQTAIANNGIKATGFGFNGTATDLMAILELTEFGKNLPQKGSHKVSLVVTDSKGKTSDVYSVIFDNQEITLELVDENPSIVYASNKAELTFDYNGLDPMEDIHFFEGGTRITPTSAIKQPATRASEKKRYLITLPLSNTVIPNVTISASQKGTTNLGSFPIPVAIPDYSISAYDAFSRYAYAQVTTTDPAMLRAVTENIKLKGNGNNLSVIDFDKETGIIKINNLSPATDYKVTYSLFEDEGWNSNNDVSFTTETEQQIPNGDFSRNGGVLQSDALLVGGDWYATNTVFTKPNVHHSSFSYNLPESWYTINEITAPSQSNVSNYNTWYVVPSSWSENGVGVMRNVGYNHNGKTLGDPKGTNTDHYCRDHPSDSDLEKAAGVLSLGSYDFSTKTSVGIEFSSRPSSISFNYEYNNDPDKVKDEFKDDKGYAFVEIMDVNGNSLGSEEFELELGTGRKEIVFKNYGSFGSKASKLIIVFKSSKNMTPPIHIPTGSELSEGDNKATDISNKTFPANTYHAVATGSILKIDNVIAHYGDEESPAPAARKPTKKKR